MDHDTARLVLTLALMWAVGLAAWFAGDVERHGYEEFTVEELFQEEPFGEKVLVHGVVDEWHGEGRTEGKRYAQFDLRQGGSTIRVYCSALAEEMDISEGQEVTVRGTFKRYRGSAEIATGCYNVERNS
jgi:RecG-like helicase